MASLKREIRNNGAVWTVFGKGGMSRKTSDGLSKRSACAAGAIVFKDCMEVDDNGFDVLRGRRRLSGHRVGI